MAKKKDAGHEVAANVVEKEYEHVVLPDIMGSSYVDYAMSVITDRALPDVRDGLKPVQRRILYAMNDMKCYPTSQHRKSARIVGEVMGKYHPHGDCLRGNTKVLMLDGTIKTMEELTKENVPQWILSIDESTGQIVPHLAHDCRVGQYTKDIYHIQFENGYEFEVTSNHPFRLTNGEWVKAEDIHANMILDFAYYNIKPDGPYVGAPVSHRTEEKLSVLVGNYLGINDNEVLHHRDFNNCNNVPDNLESLSRADHALIHKDYLSGLQAGHVAMFTPDGRYRSEIKQKNHDLALQINSQRAVIYAVHALNILSERGEELTFENYEGLRDEIYNLTKISTLVRKGIVSDFDDLVARFVSGEELYHIDYVKPEISQNGCDNDIREYTYAINDSSLLSPVVYTYETHNYERAFHVDEIRRPDGRHGSIEKYYDDEAYVKFRGEKLPVVKAVWVEHLADEEPMYDFTVDDHHNMLIPVNDDASMLVVAHNSSIYGASVYMAQPFNMGMVLIDGHGNFGSMDGDDPAAPRYTEERLSKLAMEMVRDINSNTVDFVPNFDGEEKEPTVLPARFPNLLVNGSQGIAVGMATNIPPHNLGEVCDAVCLMIDNDIKGKDTELTKLLDIVQGPDFPTGAVILGRSYRDIYETGKGKVEMEAVYHIEEDGKKDVIVFTELPFQVNKADLVADIAKYAKEKKLDIVDVRDESSREGLRVVVECKRNAMTELILNNLLQHTKLRCTYSANIMCLADGKPVQLGLVPLLRYYLEHQIDVVRRRTIFEKDKAEKRKHIVEGLLIAIDNIDEVIDIARNSVDQIEAKDRLMTRFGLSDIQAQTILDLRIRALTGLEKKKLEDELTDLIKEIARCDNILGDHKELLKLIKKEIKEIRKKYAVDRKTHHKVDYDDITIEDLIEDEPCVIIRTNIGYLKRMKPSTLRLQKKGGKGSHVATVHDDYVEDMISTSMLANIIFFTNLGRVYTVKAYKIPETARTARGTALVSLLKLRQDEFITGMFADNGTEDDMSLMILTKNGIAKRVSMADAGGVRSNGKNMIKLDDGDEVRGTLVLHDDDIVQVTTKMGYCSAYVASNVRVMGRAARGVRGIKLVKDDEVVSIQKREEGREVVVVTDKGYAKRIKCDDFTVFRGRTARGNRCIKASVTERVGCVAKVFLLEDVSNDLVITMDDGQIIKTPIDKIPVYSRQAMGTRMINLSGNPDGVVAGVVATMHEEPCDRTDDDDDETPVSEVTDFEPNADKVSSEEE